MKLGQFVGEAMRPRKLWRNEKRISIRRRLFDGAIKVIGKYGYAGASVMRITEEAGIAQGTFYLYFENRQALFDELLPLVNPIFMETVRGSDCDKLSEEDREVERCRAFFDILKVAP